MTKFAASLIGALLLLGLLLPAGASERAAKPVRTPPGQVKILSINARQNAVLGIKRFEDMFELTRAIRKRPPAFNGGFKQAVDAPDVIAMQEVRTSNVEIFTHILRQRFKTKYRLAGAEDAASQMIFNPTEVDLVGEVATWEDVCLSEGVSGRKTSRFYQYARFTEKQTGVPFTVAAIHMPKNFNGSGRDDCYAANIAELRRQLGGESGSVFVVGDFNKRAVSTTHECDPEETTAPLPWYSMMTSPSDGGPVFVDAVARTQQLRDQWTHEQKKKTLACDGSTLFRRSRIDYIFAARAGVARASADAPGWAGDAPGTKRAGVHKYSDHRFVWGRFIIEGPGRVDLPAARQGRRGTVELSWNPVTGASGYAVYRAIGRRSFDLLQTTEASTTTFDDVFTEDGAVYRYSIAALNGDGGQGRESRVARTVVDARGPQIVNLIPDPGATGVDRRADIRVRFDERVDPRSVKNDRIRLFRGKKRLSGVVRQVSNRVIEFDPTYPLWQGARHRVVLKPLRDRYSNVGAGYGWRFTVKEKRRKHKGR